MNRLVALLLILFCLSACEIDPSRKKKARLKLIEKMTAEQTDSLRVELDSLCLLHKEQQFDLLVDSVLQIRLSEIKEKVQPYE